MCHYCALRINSCLLLGRVVPTKLLIRMFFQKSNFSTFSGSLVYISGMYLMYEDKFNHHQLPSTTISYYQPPSTTINYHQLPSTTTNYHQLLSTTINYHQPPSTTINYHQPPSTTINYYRPPSATINYHQLPSATINYHQPPSNIIRLCFHRKISIKNIKVLKSIKSQVAI